MKALNNFIGLVQKQQNGGGLVFANQLQEYVVKVLNDTTKLQINDVVIAPVNKGFEYNQLKLIDEKELILKK